MTFVYVFDMGFRCFYFFHFVLFSFVLGDFVFFFVCLEFGVLRFTWFLSAAVNKWAAGINNFFYITSELWPIV